MYITKFDLQFKLKPLGFVNAKVQLVAYDLKTQLVLSDLQQRQLRELQQEIDEHVGGFIHPFALTSKTFCNIISII